MIDTLKRILASAASGLVAISIAESLPLLLRMTLGSAAEVSSWAVAFARYATITAQTLLLAVGVVLLLSTVVIAFARVWNAEPNR